MKEIFIYIAINDSFDSANKLLHAFEKTCYQLEEVPERRHIPLELKPSGIKMYLEIHHKPYRVIYDISNEIFYIHSVLEAGRNIK